MNTAFFSCLICQINCRYPPIPHTKAKGTQDIACVAGGTFLREAARKRRRAREKSISSSFSARLRSTSAKPLLSLTI